MNLYHIIQARTKLPDIETFDGDVYEVPIFVFPRIHDALKAENVKTERFILRFKKRRKLHTFEWVWIYDGTTN